MNNQQARQMPLQVQKSLREASLRTMEIQKQMTEIRLQQQEHRSQIASGTTSQIRILGQKMPEAKIPTPELLNLQYLLANLT